MSILRKYCFILAGLLTSCMSSPEAPFMKGARFDAGSRVLCVDYPHSPDTALRQIIYFSGVRKNGYGVLVNIDSAFPTSAVSALKEQFKKLDLNAIHDYQVDSREEVNALVLTAVEGARFTWVFSKDTAWSEIPTLEPLKSSIGKSTLSGGILVVL